MAMIVFVALAASLAATKAPWGDEGWFANPAYNLAFHGNMGTNVLEPSGALLNAYLRGIQQRTYYVMPNQLVGLAGWIRVFGFGLRTMRAYSIAWGCLGVCVLFYILQTLFPDPRVARLGVLLAAIDFVYLWTAADVRPECAANVLSLCSLASYLHFRSRNFEKAVFVSQILGAAAVFTHPNALIVLLAIPVLVWRSDRNRLRIDHLLMAAVPYLVFGALWSIYIFQSPADFLVQFGANAAGPESSRWKMILKPWSIVWRELERQGSSYASGAWSGVMSPYLLLVPAIYWAFLAWFIANWRKHEGGVRTFLICTWTALLVATFLNGFKAEMYMAYLMPFYDGVVAFGLINLWERGPDTKAMAAVLGIAFVSLQISASIQHIRAGEYQDFERAVARLRQERSEGKTIVGTAALGFGLGFHGFRDDWRMGQYSGLDPDVIVMDRSYRWCAKWFEDDEPTVFAHVAATLTGTHRLASRYGSFWIFERVPEGATGPGIDFGRAGLSKNGQKADFLFDQLAHSGTDSMRESAPHASVRF